MVEEVRLHGGLPIIAQILAGVRDRRLPLRARSC